MLSFPWIDFPPHRLTFYQTVDDVFNIAVLRLRLNLGRPFGAPKIIEGLSWSLGLTQKIAPISSNY